MNIKQEIETLKEKIAELEEELEKIGDEGEKKYPDKGTSVYTVTPLGEVCNFTWCGFRADEEKTLMLMFDSGEIFLSKEDAEEYAEVKQIERELYALADDDKEWDGERYHCVLSCTCDNRVDFDYFSNTRMNIPYFANGDSALKAAETVGRERVIKWLTYQRKRPQI